MTQKEKPTEAHRKELLKKLESIIKILNDKVEDNSAIPTLREPVDLSLLTADEQASTPSSNEPLEKDPTLINQRSLFKETLHQKEEPKKSYSKMENPFLPQHVRTRLSAGEKSTKPPTNPAGTVPDGLNSSKDLHDSIIDNLLALYMPRIESDLRRRLKALAAKETQDKK